MLRLFAVGKEYFDNKVKAKQYRDANGGHVSKGPDHRRFNAAAQTHVGTKGHKQGTPT
jgi:hypothetical protein